ncbi:MAG: V-type ATP synthase subunit E [Clostridia bacterium]|jgi:V/A-type H+-transporting ATPase subunit E|nr:V-type ATP synthase subunit E [Clostridia bacterium]MCI1999101.1 V-type ATP synthase subunit E [Clostridia bacterium]MCI2013851.1 V-type ATP synthase subunit E [Clostridia bacterium]
MDNGQNLINKILADANAQADEIKKTAQKEAEQIIAAAEAKAAKEKAAADKITNLEAEKAASKEISGADMQAKKLILAEKQKCIEEVIAEAEKKLASLKGEKYKNVILKMIKNADCKDSEIIFSENDKATLQKDVEDMGLKVSDETRDIEGGFVVKKGDIEYNYSFKSIITVEREEIQQIAAGILFK